MMKGTLKENIEQTQFMKAYAWLVLVDTSDDLIGKLIDEFERASFVDELLMSHRAEKDKNYWLIENENVSNVLWRDHQVSHGRLRHLV